MKLHLPSPRRPVFGSWLVAAASMTAASGAGIDVSLDPPGPIAVGATVTVNLLVTGWDAADGEVDAIAFNVDFDPAVFEFIAGSGGALADGTEFLAKANQGDAYALTDETLEAFVDLGRFVFGASDLVDATGGSVGPGGMLGSFQLRAIAASAGSLIMPQANDLDLVFFDAGFFGISPAAGVTLTGSSPAVIGSMTYAIWRSGIPFPDPAESDPEDDPDRDGMTNQIAYALDFNPLESDSHRLPSPVLIDVAGEDHLSITYLRPSGAATRSDLTYGGQRSTDVSSWSSADVVVSEAPGPPGFATVTIRSSLPFTKADEEFLRIITTF